MAIGRKLQTFRQLSGTERIAFAEAAILLTYARLMVRFVPLSHWRREVEVSAPAHIERPALSAEQRETARMVTRTIRRVGRNVPVQFVCLPQALSARWMLARRGVPTELFLGTRRAAEAEREFHAWLKAGRMMVTGHCEESDYAILGSQYRGSQYRG